MTFFSFVIPNLYSTACQSTGFRPTQEVRTRISFGPGTGTACESSSDHANGLGASGPALSEALKAWCCLGIDEPEWLAVLLAGVDKLEEEVDELLAESMESDGESGAETGAASGRCEALSLDEVRRAAVIAVEEGGGVRSRKRKRV